MTNNKQYERLYFPTPINIIQAVPAKYEQHWHSFAEIIYYPADAESGEMPVIIIDQTTYHLKPGDIVLIWSSEMHSVEYNPDRVLIGFQYPVPILVDLPEFASFSHLFRTFHLIQADDPNTKTLSEIMRQKIEEILSIRQRAESFHGIEELLRFYEMFIAFGRYLQSPQFSRDYSNRQNNSRTMEKTNQACRYIAENCDKDLTLDSVADYIGFSSCYFSRVFKQTTGYNFVEYLTLQRLKHAQTLLAESDLPITSVAMESGFKSISTFNRVFQKYKGCAPSEFKKHYFQ